MELTTENFSDLELTELESIDGGIGVVAAGLIIAGGIFVAGAVTGLCESYTENKK